MRGGWTRRVLLFSLAMNAAFVALAAVRIGVNAKPPPTPFAPGHPPWPPPPQALPERWQARRAAHLAQLLRLDARQLDEIDARLRRLGPQLRGARLQVGLVRGEFARALATGDTAGARDAARRVSRAQASLDSLSAEAMLQEMSVLRPEQRDVYLRAMFRPGPLPLRGRGPWHFLAPGLLPGAMDFRPGGPVLELPAPRTAGAESPS